MGKLSSISRSQRFRSAYKAALAFLILAQFLRSGSPVWGAAFVLFANFLYFRRTANVLHALPLFTGAVLTPFFFPHNLGVFITTLFAALIAGLLYVAFGVKDLALIHRESLLEVGGYALSYIALLLFFMQVMAGGFLLVWLYAVFCIWLSFLLIARDYRVALLFATLMGELIWIISWLPIGFLNSASLCFAVLLFMGDATQEKKISPRNTIILGAIIILIFITSHFRL